MSSTQKRILFFVLVLIVLSGVAILVIKLAQGYKPDFSTRTLRPTGLLVVTSVPDGAQVFIDGKLRSATNTTLSLSPDEYEVEIKKDGFTSWKKRLEIKKELVTETDAYLFSSFPDLRALTFTGATNPVLSPDGMRVVFAVATASASKQGLWVLDLTDRPLGLAREPRQIVASTPSRDFSQAEYRWSPDSKQILATFKTTPIKGKTAKTKEENFLLDTDKLNPPTSLVDITPTLNLVLERWEKEKEVPFQAQLSKLPEELLSAIKEKVVDIQFAPDETKIIYTATGSAAIPEKIIPPPPTASTQPEDREIKPGRIYVYDLKEDKNFFITEAITFSWFPTSKHIFLVQSDRISIVDYDGTNRVDVYTGPFVNSFAFPFPTGNRILVLTSIGKDTPPNLYAVTLR